MKLSQMTKEEIEQLSYTKIAELYLKENKTTLNTASLFKVVCQLLELDEETYKVIAWQPLPEPYKESDKE